MNISDVNDKIDASPSVISEQAQPHGRQIRNRCTLTEDELADPEFVKAYIEGCDDSFNELMVEVTRLRQLLAARDGPRQAVMTAHSESGEGTRIRARFIRQDQTVLNLSYDIEIAIDQLIAELQSSSGGYLCTTRKGCTARITASPGDFTSFLHQVRDWLAMHV